MATADFPATITDKLFDAVPRKSTTLSSDITNSVTTIPVGSTAGFPSEGYVVIENETIYYTGTTATTFTGCTRGFAGTAVAHLATVAVRYAVVAQWANQVNAEIKAIEGEVGISGSTSTASLNYKILNLGAITQAGSTMAAGLNAQYLGGSTSGEFLASAGTAADSELVDGIEGTDLAANDIMIMANGFIIAGSDCELVETDGTDAKLYDKHLAVAKTEWFDVPKIRIPDTYDGGDIDITVCFRSAGASKKHSLGIRVASVGASDPYNPDLASAYQLYNEESSDATIGDIKYKTVTVTQSNHKMVAGENWYCKFVMEDDAGADADDVLIESVRIEWNKG